jgi:hypothetical protein
MKRGFSTVSLGEAGIAAERFYGEQRRKTFAEARKTLIRVERFWIQNNLSEILIVYNFP